MMEAVRPVREGEIHLAQTGRIGIVYKALARLPGRDAKIALTEKGTRS
jgi:hypothetical protein